MFLAFGLGIGLWSGASGAILARSGVDPATFGVLLTLYTGVYLLAMSSGGALSRRFGVRSTLGVAAILTGVALCWLLSAASPATVAGSLIAAGFLAGLVDVTMNAEGARIERALARPILARLHAAASAGMGVGAIFGSLISASRVPWCAGLIAAAALAFAAIAYERSARSEPRTAPAATTSTRGGLSFAPSLIALGIVLGLSIAAETAASLWSALFLRAEAPSLAAIAGLGTAFFAGCQAMLRFNADLIRLRVRDRTIIIASFAIAAAGFGLVAWHEHFALSVLGFALIGIGTGAIVPCGFALSARQSPGEPAVGLASASLFSAATRLPAPLATGIIAQNVSLPAAFGTFAIALALAAVGMGALKLRARANSSVQRSA